MIIRTRPDGTEYVRMEDAEIKLLSRCAKLAEQLYKWHPHNSSRNLGQAIVAVKECYLEKKETDEDGGEPTTEQLRGV